MFNSGINAKGTTMEVDQEKETDAGVVDQLSLDDMPNEILLMIFRSLDFRYLLGASVVNHRWNELAFFLLQNRISLRLDHWASKTGMEWTFNRTYAAVSFRSDLNLSLDCVALNQLAEDVRKLELTCRFAIDKDLLEFLRAFSRVETLLLNVDRLRRLKSPASFLRDSRGLLPSVRHLTLRCKYMRIAVLLAEVAPKLVTLDMELVARLLPNICECRFDCLQSLTLRFKLAVVVASWSLRGKEDLIRFLRQIPTLRKLGLFVDSDYSAFEVAFDLTSIEELTLGGKFKGRRFANLGKVSQMTNLRSLTLAIEAESFGIWRFQETPNPTVETLKTNGPIDFTLPNVITKFPNLKVLSIATTVFTEQDVQAIVGSTWENTMEELTIKIPSIDPNIVACFVFLRKLKKLCLICGGYPKDLLAPFNAIVAMDSMKELHIRNLRGMEWYESAVELDKCNPNCAVYIDGYPTKYYEAFFH